MHRQRGRLELHLRLLTTYFRLRLGVVPGRFGVLGIRIVTWLILPVVHMLVSKIKPCMSKYKQLYRETANAH